MKSRISQFLRLIRCGKFIDKSDILIDRFRDHIEVKPFGFARRLEHIKRQAFLRRIGQPFLNGQPIAFDLDIFSPFSSRKELIGKALGRVWPSALVMRDDNLTDLTNPYRPFHNQLQAPPSASPNRLSIAACTPPVTRFHFSAAIRMFITHVPAATSTGSIATIKTLPLVGQIGKTANRSGGVLRPKSAR